MSRRTQDLSRSRSGLRLRGFHPVSLCFPAHSAVLSGKLSPTLLQPQFQLVWAGSLSLAATREITFVFFSSGYLDVSVPRVPLSQTMCSSVDDSPPDCRVPPFGHRRVFASLRLSVAFRCLARPSSVQCGQASSLRPSLLDLILFT